MPSYQRVLLKLSGEILSNGTGQNFDGPTLARLAREVKDVHDTGIELMIVVGGGNIFRASTHAHPSMDRVQADYMGMLATMINGLALQDAFERAGLYTRVMSAIPADKVVEPFIPRRAIRHAEKGRVVILVAGSGNPFFTTDSAAILRAAELKCEIVLKGTKVDGIYSADPKKDGRATRFERLSHQEVIDQDLTVMDMTAFTLAKDNALPILVFNILEEGNLARAVRGEQVGTLVSSTR